MNSSEDQANNKMAMLRIPLVLLMLVFLSQPVSAFDAGDAAALVIGLVLGILGICACLGAYARKRAGTSL